MKFKLLVSSLLLFTNFFLGIGFAAAQSTTPQTSSTQQPPTQNQTPPPSSQQTTPQGTTTTTNTPPPQCASGQYWNGTTCQTSSATYIPSPQGTQPNYYASGTPPALPPIKNWQDGSGSSSSQQQSGISPQWNTTTNWNTQGPWQSQQGGPQGMPPPNMIGSPSPQPQPGFMQWNGQTNDRNTWPTSWPRPDGTSSTFSNSPGMQGGAQFNQNQQEQFQKEAEQHQSDMMAREGKRMAKQFGSIVKKLQSIQKRLSTRGIPLPQACTDAIHQTQDIMSKLSSVASSSDMSTMLDSTQDLQDTLQGCMMEGQQLLSAPQMMATMKRMLSLLSRKGIDISDIKNEYDTYMVSAYAAIKSGSATDDDIQAFFDTANDIRSQMEDAMSQTDLAIPAVFKTFDAGQGHIMNQTPQNMGAPSPSTGTPSDGTIHQQSDSPSSGSPTNTSANVHASSQPASAYDALVQLIARLHASSR